MYYIPVYSSVMSTGISNLMQFFMEHNMYSGKISSQKKKSFFSFPFFKYKIQMYIAPPISSSPLPAPVTRHPIIIITCTFVYQ